MRLKRIRKSNYDSKYKKIKELSDDLPRDAYEVFKKNTPIDTGNARRNTDLDRTTINADYPYAVRLNNGYSRQAPNGMTEPTIKYIQRQIRSTFGR